MTHSGVTPVFAHNWHLPRVTVSPPALVLGWAGAGAVAGECQNTQFSSRQYGQHRSYLLFTSWLGHLGQGQETTSPKWQFPMIDWMGLISEFASGYYTYYLFILRILSLTKHRWQDALPPLSWLSTGQSAAKLLHHATLPDPACAWEPVKNNYILIAHHNINFSTHFLPLTAYKCEKWYKECL